MNSGHPIDVLYRAASLIRWNQRLLCSLGPDQNLGLSPEESAGLYWTLEEILEQVSEVIKTLQAEEVV